MCLILLVAVWAPLGAADKPKDLIVGKWEPVENKGQAPTIEFTKDGKLKISIAQMTIEGTYKFLDDNNVEVEISFMGQTQKEKMKVECTKDEMTTTDSKNKAEKFKRVK
jgi:uncharacterized protein (TIGR03066 family)